MEAWQWILVLLAGASAIFVMGSIIWAVFDVFSEVRLDQTTRVLWVVLLFVLPLLGLLAWLYAKPRLASFGNSARLRKTL
ncbi:PLDc N-terminal domain-containing protein [Paenarthrobacter nitroguajacolicus]|uniref:PLDc N-terminal domain-containing protein n=1 Tax=Paenarthrobacter nitroguajacolicus TaxID=211146 RepID=UPI0034341443